MSADRTGIIAVDRMAFLAQIDARGGVARPSATGMTNEEVFKQYRGFDGIVWPDPVRGFVLADGMAPIDSLVAVRHYVSSMRHPENCDIVLITDRETQLPRPRKSLQFLGYEVGYFESEVSHFSSLLNEVLYGIEREMTAFCKRLNRSLLLDSRADADELLSIRAALQCRGADLEEGIFFGAYSVYSLKDSCTPEKPKR